MAIFKPEVLALWIEQDCMQSNFQTVRKLLAASFRNRVAKYSDEKIAELSEELTPAASNALEKRKADYIQDGIVPPFEISVDAGDYYYKAIPTPEIDLLKRLRNCSPAGFEVFCKFVLARMKADAFAEGGPCDGGVDFYSIGLSPGSLIDPIPPAAKTVVIGQAKRYSETNNVGEVELRTFVGGTIKKADELRRNYPDRFGLLTPVLLAFWTTGDFIPSARKYARDLGIWYLNGVGFSQLALRLGLTAKDIENADIEAVQLKTARLPGISGTT